MVAELLVELAAWVLVLIHWVWKPLLLGATLTGSVRVLRILGERTLNERAVGRWRRLVCKLHRIRRLQRIFGSLGLHLRDNLSKKVLKKLKED